MKKVVICYDMWWEAKVEIKEGSEPIMKEMLDFWMGGEDMIYLAGGDIETAWLRMLGRNLLPMSMEWNLEGCLSQFEEMEGWVPLDGSHGITLVHVDRWEFDDLDIGIKEET